MTTSALAGGKVTLPLHALRRELLCARHLCRLAAACGPRQRMSPTGRSRKGNAPENGQSSILRALQHTLFHRHCGLCSSARPRHQGKCEQKRSHCRVPLFCKSPSFRVRAGERCLINAECHSVRGKRTLLILPEGQEEDKVDFALSVIEFISASDNPCARMLF